MQALELEPGPEEPLRPERVPPRRAQERAPGPGPAREPLQAREPERVRALEQELLPRGPAAASGA